MKITKKLVKSKDQRITKTEREKQEKQMLKENVAIRIFVKKDLDIATLETLLSQYLLMAKQVGIKTTESNYHLCSMHTN